MTKKVFDLLEKVDSVLATVIDDLDSEKENQLDWQDEEAVQDWIDTLEKLRGDIND